MNLLSGKVLVGSSKDVWKRRWQHLNSLRVGKHPNRPFQTAWDRDGPDAWKFELLEEVPQKWLIVRERAWIGKLRAIEKDFGYNICAAASTRLGAKWSEESKRRQSELFKAKGIKPPPKSYRLSRKATKGKPRSAEVRAKISAANKGKKRTAAMKQALSLRLKGRKHTPETKAKISATRDFMKTAEFKAFSSTHSLARHARLRANPEALAAWKAKIGAGQKRRWDRQKAI